MKKIQLAVNEMSKLNWCKMYPVFYNRLTDNTALRVIYDPCLE